MSKKDQFTLNFWKSFDPVTGRRRNFCRADNIHYNRPAFIEGCNVHGCEFLIEEIDRALNNQYFEPEQSSESFGVSSIEIVPPNIIINDLVVSLTDMRGLLNEWIDFLNS